MEQGRLIMGAHFEIILLTRTPVDENYIKYDAIKRGWLLQ